MSKSFRGETLAGKTFNDLTVLNFIPDETNKSKWLCICKCGNTRLVEKTNLTSGKIKKCHNCGNSHLSLENQKFGMLTVIKKTSDRYFGSIVLIVLTFAHFQSYIILFIKNVHSMILQFTVIIQN